MLFENFRDLFLWKILSSDNYVPAEYPIADVRSPASTTRADQLGSVQEASAVLLEGRGAEGGEASSPKERALRAASILKRGLVACDEAEARDTNATLYSNLASVAA